LLPARSFARASYLACEGRVVAIVASEQAEMALNLWQALPQGEQAAVIGYVQANEPARVVLETELGGERVLEELLDDPLPRIC
jgi:hydrogenase expression/formation protein HypE